MFRRRRCKGWMKTVRTITLATDAIATIFPLDRAYSDENAPVTQHDRWVTSVAFSPDGGTLITAGGQSLQYRPGDVQLWDTKTGKLLADLKGHKANVWSLAVSPDGKLLVTSSYSGEVIVWDVAKKEKVAALEKYKSWVRSVAFAPDGKHFATAGEDGSATVWAVEGTKEAKTIKAHGTAIYGLAFSPDSKTVYVANAGSNSVSAVDIASRREVARIPVGQVPKRNITAVLSQRR